METIKTRARAKYDLALTHLKPYALRCRELAAARFNIQPHLSLAAIVFASGFLAILIYFPTQQGSTTLAGALFGAGAAFIGAWVTEKNRTASEKILLAGCGRFKVRCRKFGARQGSSRRNAWNERFLR